MVRCRALAVVTLLAACTPIQTPDPQPRHGHRAILVSFDALNEARALETLPAHAIPAFRELFQTGQCADWVTPAWPSKTSASHAALWTGVYGDSNGVAANSQPVLPRERHRITELGSGYSAAALRAEPLWISETLKGRIVVAHHPTQAPEPPGYPTVSTTDTAPSTARSRAIRALASERLSVINGYAGDHVDARIVTGRDVRWEPADRWRSVDWSRTGRTGRAMAFAVGQDSVFGLVARDSLARGLLLSRTRDARDAVFVRAAAAHRSTAAAPAELASDFSSPLTVSTPAGPSSVRVRLFSLADSGDAFELYVPGLSELRTNRADTRREYLSAVAGWVGNGAGDLYRRGALGRTIPDGGDGTAENRYLETLELVTLGYMQGSEWAWRTKHADLVVDYFPVIDEVDHLWFGYASPVTPGVTDRVRDQIALVRGRGWQLADLRLRALMQLVASDSLARLFVAGDHGMRPTWRVFRPNVALRQAGLLVTDSAGEIVASRTMALGADGLYISLNRVGWQDGMVLLGDVDALLSRAEQALRQVRDAESRPVVTRVWRVPPEDSLGRGGPTGGDLYFETAAGYVWSREATGPVIDSARIGADHGFPSVSGDMRTVTCEWPAAGTRTRSPGTTLTRTRARVEAWLEGGR